MVLVLDVAGHRDAGAPGLADPVARDTGVGFLFGKVADEDVGAFAREGDGDGAADAAVAAGDQRLPTGEPPEPRVRGLAMIGGRVHFRVEPRRLYQRLWILRRWSGGPRVDG